MNLTSILISLIGVLLISLIASSIAKHQFKHILSKKAAINSKKTQAKQLQEIIEGLARTPCLPEIKLILGKLLVETLGEIKDIEPNYPGIDVVIAAAEHFIEFSPEQMIQTITPAETDHEVATLQKMTLAAMAKVKKCPAYGKCTYAEVQTWEHHLKMIYIQISIDAHLAKAEASLLENDRAQAATHLRIAQNKLAQSRYHGPEKKDLMINLGNRIRGLYQRSE